MVSKENKQSIRRAASHRKESTAEAG